MLGDSDDSEDFIGGLGVDQEKMQINSGGNEQDQYGFERLLQDDSINQDIQRNQSVMERIESIQEESKDGSGYVSSNILISQLPS